MIKNLIYGALGVGGVAMAALADTPAQCTVTLDANGGTFLPGTSTVQRVKVAYSNAIYQAFNQVSVTNINHDFVGWTKDGTDVITNTMPVVSDMECFAKWQRSAIQQFEVANGVFEGEVVQFPAVFYGTAWTYDTTNQVVHFKVPESATNEGYRVSFDPQVGFTRLATTMTITQNGVSTDISFSTPTSSERIIRFLPGADCTITFWPTCPASVNCSRYALGIGLEGVQVSFDSNDAGKGYGTKGFSEANYTLGYPYGDIPSMTTPRGSQVTFKGWYPTKTDGERLWPSNIVGTIKVYYAQWQFPSVPYTVVFNKTYEEAEGWMDSQQFKTEVKQALSYNRFYWAGHSFVGWATSRESAQKEKWKYRDGETVVNLTERPYAKVDLFAVWCETPGTNNYTVSQYVNEFKNVALSSNVVTFVSGTGSYSTFALSVTNSATLRVSLDPKAGTDRAGAKLTIYKEVTGGSWSNVCEVTDLATTNTVYSFKAGTTYRFNVTGVGASYAYVVGLGAKGAQVDFESFGVAATGPYSTARSFNWSVGMPYAHEPKLASCRYGDFLWWDAKCDYACTNKFAATNLVESGENKYYARWKNSPYWVAFEGGVGASGDMSVQELRYDIAERLSANLFNRNGSRFTGWDTNSNATKVVYKDAALVTNLWGTAYGVTNKLYAVWEDSKGTNWYYVTSTATNFENVAVSPTNTLYFIGKGSASVFYVPQPAGGTNDCRVAIDPGLGFLRNKNTPAKLTVDCASVTTNGVSAWTTVCTVTDFATEEVRCQFLTNYNYRFTVSGVAATNEYRVSIGAAGEQVMFDSGLDGKGKESYNWTVGSFYGYLPKLTNDTTRGTFLGWYADPVATNAPVTVKTEVAPYASGTNTVYAHWANYQYYVVFDANGGCGWMEPQAFVRNEAKHLSANRFYWSLHEFAGWSTDRTSTNVVYQNGEMVTNLCDRAGDTKTLYAVWNGPFSYTEYQVISSGDVFSNAVFSALTPARFRGTFEEEYFDVLPVLDTTVRVSIDPSGERRDAEEEDLRVNARVTVERAPVSTNSVEDWETVCETSDLTDKPATCKFVPGYVYRFTVSDMPDGYEYVIGLGDKGVQLTFDPCGGKLVEDPPSTLFSFNWTVGTPVGYLPPIADDEKLGKAYWCKTAERQPEEDDPDPEEEEDPEEDPDPDAESDEDEEEEEEDPEEEEGYEPDPEILVDRSETLDEEYPRTLYVQWENGLVYRVTFDWNLEEYGVVSNVVHYYQEGATIHLYGEERDPSVPVPTYETLGFLGWTTNGEDEVLCWDVSPFVVSNEADFVAQWSKDWRTEPMGDGLCVNGYDGQIAGEFVIPPTIAPCPRLVIGIGESAFASRMGMTSVSIPSNVVFVGDGAFSNCTALATVRFPTKEVRDENATGGYLAKIVGEQDDDPVELGTDLFLGCTALTDVQLPLGVMRLPDGIFFGCSSLRSFDMPYTVVEIGSNAFARCTRLGDFLVVTEGVADIGSGAFLKCSRLKGVRFLGKQPGGSSVATDIFKGTQRTMLVGYLENMCVTAKDYCGGDWPELPGTWPSGSSYARTLTWIGDGKYPRRIVKFNYNKGLTPVQSEEATVLCHVGRVFGFVAPTAADMGSDFGGWWTQPVGGRRVGNYRKITEAMTVYAHWGKESGSVGDEIGSRSAKDYPVHFNPNDPNFTGFYSADDDLFYYAPCTFDGVVVTAGGATNLAGTIVVTCQQGGGESGEMQAPFTAVVTWNDGSQTSFGGVVDADGMMYAAAGEFALSAEVTKSGIFGSMTGGAGYKVYAARNRYAMSNDASVGIVLTSLYATRGVWHVVLESDEDAPDVANGYSTLAVTISGMGQATVTGTLADGTAVSATSRLIIGDGCCCLPVNLRPYGGSGGLACLLWYTWMSDGSFGDDEAKVVGLTEWTTPWFKTKVGPAKIRDAEGNVKDFPLTFIDDKRYSGDAEFLCEQQTLAKLRMNDTTWTVVGDNPDGLQILYQPATGLFTGNVAIRTDDGRAGTAVVNGAFTDRISEEGEVYHGFGTAVVNGIGSAKVEITTVD